MVRMNQHEINLLAEGRIALAVAKYKRRIGTTMEKAQALYHYYNGWNNSIRLLKEYAVEERSSSYYED